MSASLVSSAGHWEDPWIEDASLQLHAAYGLPLSPVLELKGCDKKGLLFLLV